MKHLIAILLLAAVTAGQPCPEQQFPPLTGVDPTRIAVDPLTGQPCLLGIVPVWLPAGGSTVVPLRGYICDPDTQEPNSPQTLKVSCRETGRQLVLDPQGYYALVVPITAPGDTYLTFEGTDGIDTRAGTVVIRARVNRPPHLGPCGGLSH